MAKFGTFLSVANPAKFPLTEQADVLRFIKYGLKGTDFEYLLWPKHKINSYNRQYKTDLIYGNWNKAIITRSESEPTQPDFIQGNNSQQLVGNLDKQQYKWLVRLKGKNYQVTLPSELSKNPVEHWIVDNDTNRIYLTLKTADRSKAEKIANDLNKKAKRERYIVRGFGVENPAKSLGLWRYSELTGYWVHQRNVTKATAEKWLQIFSDDEPNAYFKIAVHRPNGKPKK